MARNASNLLNRPTGYKASVDASGNIVGPGLTGTYVQIGAVRIYGFSSAITANSTSTSAPAGSMAFTTNATGRGRLFYSDGSKWQSGFAEDNTA
jgi:hypothetical protein